MIEVRYLPAILAGFMHLYAKNTDEQFKERFKNVSLNPRFFNEGAAAYAPHFLVSAPVVKPKFKEKANPDNHETVKQLLGIDEKAEIFIDSGGFSLMTGALKEKDWTNKDAFDFSIKNGSVFPILDRPVIPGCDFEKNLKLSLESAQYYYDRKDEAVGKTILNVVHGTNYDQIKTWTDAISKIQLDGWALGSSHRGDTKEIILTILYLLESGNLEKCKYLHVFGVSGTENILYFNALKHLFEKYIPDIDMIISYDSTSPFMSFSNGVLYYSHSVDKIQKIDISNRNDWSDFAHLSGEDYFPCNCDYCNSIQDIEMMMCDTTEYYMWGYLHNLKVQMDFIKSNALSLGMCYREKTGKLFESVLGKKAALNLECLDDAFSDLKNAEEIIRNRFLGKNKKSKSDFSNLDKFLI